MTGTDENGDAVLTTLDLLSKKWHPVIVQRLLAESPLRFSEFQNRIEGISAKVLTDSLEDLVENDLVERTVVSESPRHVEYDLTAEGRDLELVLNALADWGEEHLGPDSRPTVLVVDDDPRLARMHAGWLADTYDVIRAHGGSEGLRLLDDDVDLVLLDRRMPGLSGDDLLSRIERRGIDCRVVMLTAVEPNFDVVDMPFDAYVNKPVTPDQLTSLVRDVLERNAYDLKLLEYLSLSAKESLLRGEMTEAELASNEEYAWLRERLDELEADLDEPAEEDDVEELVQSVVEP